MSHICISLDPLKVQSILNIPPLCTLRQLQSLQGKANFLCRFILDYVTKVHGFLRLLCTNIPFVWDEHVQGDFNALKQAPTSAPLLSPPDFTKEFILYMSASENAIVGVLVQVDDTCQDHMIYYISHKLFGPPLRYSHEEKMALFMVFLVQNLCHYVLLNRT